MKRLRRHARVDTLANQQRAASMRWGRFVYLGLLAIFGTSLAYWVAGETVVLSLDGTVLRDRAVADAAYVGKVTDVFVREGERVEAGQALARLESADMVRQLADMRYRAGELAMRTQTVRSRIASAETVAPLAQRSADESGRAVARLDTVVDRGIVSSITRNEALKASLDAADRLAALTQARQTATAELDVIAAAHADSTRAVAQLSRIYDDGFVRAPAAGIVGAKVPALGHVVQVGEEMMQVNGGRAYLLAYLPDRYVFGVAAGMAVTVSGGGRSVRGTVEDVLAVAEALPAEFQAMFRPRDRSRLVRVALPDDQPFAVSQKVTVGGCAFGLCWAR